MAGTCRIHLLGSYECEVDGHVVPEAAWRGQSGELVVLLALDPARQLHRDDVIAKLWPSASRRDAEHELSRAVKDARKAMRDGRAVTTEGERLRLWPHGELWIDAHTFLAKAKHARNAEQREAAAAMYTGDLLLGWPDPGIEELRKLLRLTYLELLRDPDSATPAWIDLRGPAQLRSALR
jgi:DNA-binding SARP family transcriptional activator